MENEPEAGGDAKREKRKQYLREYNRKRWAAMTPEQKAEVYAKQRERLRSLTPEQRRERSEYQRKRVESMTEEQREALRAYRREWWKNLSPEQKEKKRASRRKRVESMTEEQREALRAYYREWAKNLSPEQRKAQHARKLERFLSLPPEKQEEIRRKRRERARLYRQTERYRQLAAARSSKKKKERRRRTGEPRFVGAPDTPLGRALASIRMPQSHLARLVGVSYNYMNRIVGGKCKPSRETEMKIFSVLADHGASLDLREDGFDGISEREREAFLVWQGGRAIENPVQAIGDIEVVEVVHAALDELPELQRGVLEDRFFGGMTLDEISGRRRVSREAVRQLELKGLKKLRHPCRIKKLEAVR